MGRVNTEYADSVIAKVTSPEPSIEETVDRVMLITREARDLSDRGHFAQARDKYKSALVQAYTRVPDHTGNIVLRKGLLAGRAKSSALGYLNIMLKCKIAMCYAKLDEWEETHYWACAATYTKFFPTRYTLLFYRIAWVDAESNKAVQEVETLMMWTLKSGPKAVFHMDWDLSDLKQRMRSKEGMDNLRALKAAMKELTDQDRVGDSN